MISVEFQLCSAKMSRKDAIFLYQDIRELFKGKTIVVLGDSIQRSVYKDLVCLWSDPQSRYVENNELKKKGELSFRHDKLLLGGDLGEKTNNVDAREEREYQDGNTVFRYYFVTRCWNDYVQSVVENQLRTIGPHVIIMNSCLWDIHRYGEEGKKLYEYNLNKLFTAVTLLPSAPLMVWTSALPLAEVCKGGFLRKGFKTLSWQEINMANFSARAMTGKFHFIYVDLFESLSRHHMFTQAGDGIHWENKAHRNMSNSILAAISDCWGYSVVDKVPTALLPIPNIMPGLNDVWSQRYDDFQYHNGYYDDRYIVSPMGGYVEYNYIDRRPRSALLPNPFLSPLPPPPIHRYHPYYPPMVDNIRYLPYFAVAGQRTRHQRSHTDPFPVGSARNNYRSRFKTVNKKPVVSSGSTATVPSNSSETNAGNTRRPLRECNGSAGQANSSASTRSPSLECPSTIAQANPREEEANSLEKEPGCSSGPSSVDISHNDTSPESTPGKSTVPSNTEGISESIVDQKSAVYSTVKSGEIGEGSGLSAVTGQKDYQNSTDKYEKLGEGSGVSIADLNDVGPTDKSGVVEEESVVGQKSESDVNNNESARSVENERKRKREEESDEEEQKPEKAAKLA